MSAGATQRDLLADALAAEVPAVSSSSGAASSGAAPAKASSRAAPANTDSDEGPIDMKLLAEQMMQMAKNPDLPEEGKKDILLRYLQCMEAIKKLEKEEQEKPTYTHLFICLVFGILQLFVFLGTMTTGYFEFDKHFQRHEIVYPKFEGTFPAHFTRMTTYMLETPRLKALTMIKTMTSLVPLLVMFVNRTRTLAALVALCDMGGFRLAFHKFYWTTAAADEDGYFMFVCTAIAFLVIQTDPKNRSLSRNRLMFWMVLAYVVGFCFCLFSVYALNYRLYPPEPGEEMLNEGGWKSRDYLEKTGISLSQTSTSTTTTEPLGMFDDDL